MIFILTAGQKQRLRRISQECCKSGDHTALYAAVQGLATSWQTPLEQLSPAVQEDGEQAHLGVWARIKERLG